MTKKNVFTPGPLYEKRKQLLANLEKLNLKTGDIVFNSSNVKGPFGIPFAKWVQKYTNSKYSHATIMYVDKDEYYAIDVSDYGTRKLRVLDWFDNWEGIDFCVYRLKNINVFDKDISGNWVSAYHLRDYAKQALKEAREQGDLSENADYDAARDEQARIEGRIKEIEAILKNYEIIKEDTTNKVNIGKTVVIKVADLEDTTYTIVGSLEADPLNGKISNESPIGKGIIGCKKGQTVTVKTETGHEIKVVIVDVKK